jgi:hypothetical protein
MSPSASVAIHRTPPDGVRPVQEGDLPAIGRLHRQVFGGRRPEVQRLDRFLAEVFCGHPWIGDACPSLVCEDATGQLIGCLGVMPRPMVFRGRPVMAAVTHHFMVAPDQRASWAALQLMRTFLAGPQDLSLAEGNEASRRVWEGLHLSTAMLYSLHWIRPLRPTAWISSSIGTRTSRLLRPITAVADAWLGRMSTRLAPPTAPDLTASTLDTGTIVGHVKALAGTRSLIPDYEVGALRWQFDVLARKPGAGTLQMVALRNARQEIAGWYIYYLCPGQTSEVVQITGTARSLPAVFDHLAAHAYQGGAVALAGRLDPVLLPVCAARRCWLRAGRSWMLLHAENPELTDAITRGDACLSPLDGEWWMSARA